MPSLVQPDLEDFNDKSDSRGAVVQPKPVVQTEERAEEVTNHTVLDSKGHPSTELPDFLEEARKMEEVRERGEEPEKTKKVDRRQRVESKPAEEPNKEADVSPKPKENEELKETPLADEDLKVRPNDRPLTARRINQLIQKVSYAEKTVGEKEAIIKELQAKASTAGGNEELAKMKEALDKTNADLLRYRRRYDLDSDPEIKTKFDEPVIQAENSIKDTLNKYSLGEATLKEIERHGGFAEFSRAGKLFTVNEPDPNDPQATVRVQKTAGELVKSWLNAMNPADSEYVRAQMARQFQAKDEKKRFFDQETAQSDKYFKAQEEQRSKQTAEQTASMEKLRKDYGDWADGQIKERDWLKDKEIPTGASAEQKKQIEEHNKFKDQLRTMVRNPPTSSPEKVKEILLGGVEAHHLRRENGSLMAQVKELKAELDKVKNGSRTTPKAGSILSSTRKSDDSKKSIRGADIGEIFEQAISARERGEDDDSL